MAIPSLTHPYSGFTTFLIAFVAELFALQMKMLTPMISKMISKESAPIEMRRPVGREVVSSPGRIIIKPKFILLGEC